MGMIQLRRILYVFMLIWLCFPMQSVTSAATAYYYNDQRKVELDGAWFFFHEQLYDGLASRDHIQEAAIVNVPIEFKALTGYTHTYGTFAKEIVLPSHLIGKTLAIVLPDEYSAVKLFVDGQELTEIGRVGTSSETHETMLQSRIVTFEVKQPSFMVALQISSFEHMRGGFANPIYIGNPDYISEKNGFSIGLMSFFTGIIFIVGVLTVLIGLLHRQEKIFLAFGLFCILVSIRTIFTAPFLYHHLPIDFSYIIATKIEYITTSLIVYFYALFVYLIYKDIFSRLIIYSFSFVLFLLVGITIFTEPLFFQQAFFKLIIIIFGLVVYSVFIIYRAFRARKMFAIPIIIGVVIVLTGWIVDYLSGIGMISIMSLPMSQFAITFNVVIIVYSLSRDYTMRIKEISSLNDELHTMNQSLDGIVQERTQQLSDANNLLKELATKDSLTGIYNRHKFNEVFTSFFHAAQNSHHPLSVIIMDVDEFKKYNDFYGHIKGDELLVQLVQIIQRSLPQDVIFARYGGEEFVLILPNYPINKAAALGEYLRHSIEAAQIEHLGRTEGIITISLGVAELTECINLTSGNELLDVADQRLYLSKRNGRNQITFTS